MATATGELVNEVYVLVVEVVSGSIQGETTWVHGVAGTRSTADRMRAAWRRSHESGGTGRPHRFTRSEDDVRDDIPTRAAFWCACGLGVGVEGPLKVER